MKRLFSLLTLAGAALALTGCNSPLFKKADAALFTPTAWVTNHVTEKTVVVETNRVVLVTQTNLVTGEVNTATNRERITINLVTPAHDEIKPVAFEANRDTTAAVSGLASFIPGYGTAVGWGFTALLGLVAHLRSGRYKDAAVSVAQGVEHYMALNPGQATAIKSTLAGVQAQDGTTGTVRALLRDEVVSRPQAS